MDLNAIFELTLTTSCRLVAATLLFGLLTRLMPCNPGMYWWKQVQAAVTDFFYWIAVPVFLANCTTIVESWAIGLLFGGAQPNLLPVRGLPLWQQCLLVLVLQDLMLYPIHRWFHGRLGWRFHAVHHSPQQLDWFAAARFHPLNQLLAFNLANIIILLLGFSPVALLLLNPFNFFYSTMVHANLNWTFGPLRYVFASPVFHRWHHTSEDEGLDKNFASTFPVLDLIFGTFYMPPDRLPQRYGISDPAFPDDLLGQFLYPFVRPAPASPAPAEAAGTEATEAQLTAMRVTRGRRKAMALPVQAQAEASKSTEAAA